MNVLQSKLINKVCRLCLTSSNCCIHMDSKWGETMQLRIRINNLLPFQINDRDGCSRYICWDCCMHVQLLNTFVEKCVQRNETLKGAAGNLCSQSSQGGSCVSMLESADGSVCNWNEQRFSDWLSQSFQNEENTDGAAQVVNKKLKPTICKRKSCKTKKIASANKENRCKVTAGLQPQQMREGARKVGKFDGSPSKYDLRQSTRLSRPTLAPGKDRDAHRTSETVNGLKRETREPSEPLLIFSRNAARESNEDALSGKTISELSFVIDMDTKLTPKNTHDGRGDQLCRRNCLLQNFHAPDNFNVELKSLLDCPCFPGPSLGVTGGQQESGQKTNPNANFFCEKKFLGMQQKYHHDEDITAQFARRHLSLLC